MHEQLNLHLASILCYWSLTLDLARLPLTPPKSVAAWLNSSSVKSDAFLLSWFDWGTSHSKVDAQLARFGLRLCASSWSNADKRHIVYFPPKRKTAGLLATFPGWKHCRIWKKNIKVQINLLHRQELCPKLCLKSWLSAMLCFSQLS
jgi:hypothetical protein